MKKVYDKKCPYCGNEFMGSKGQIFCSHACANMGRSVIEVEDYDNSLTWEKDSDRLWICPYAKNVGCRIRKCNECGWNPKVAKARSIEIKRKLMAVEE